MPKRTPMGKGPRRDPGSRIFVLVVDDNSSLRTVVRRVLEDNGHAVFEAKDGLDGLEKFRRDPHRFHVVVMDIEMPRMDGTEAFREMRAIRKDVPVIVLSGSEPEKYENRLPVAELAGILQKPFDLNDLLSAVGRCAPRPGSGPGSAELQGQP